jgi:monoamine oxidase
VAHLHPRAPRFLGHGVSVGWKNVPYSRAGWAEWSPKARAVRAE